MKNLNIDLGTDSATLCYCWRVQRQDGTVIGFTDHDRDIGIYKATTGLTTTKIVRRVGLSVDNLEIEGIIDDEIITSVDIEAGLYDNATVDIYLVNWKVSSQSDLVVSGTFGNVSQVENGFAAEFRALAHRLNQTSGRIYQRTCDTKLGSARCGVNLNDPQYRVTATVTSFSDQDVTVNSTQRESGYFALGTLIDANGASHKIRTHRGAVMRLSMRPVIDITVGSNVTLIAGCKQDSETCRTKFNNIRNFQGFPFMPGNDQMTNYPVRGEGDLNGGSLFK